MPDTRCLYTSVDAPLERGDEVLLRFVAPVAREIRSHPDLDSLFYCRYNDPTWQIRFRIVGTPRWIEESVLPSLEERLAPLKREDLIQGYAFGQYRREVERYGGEYGMWLTERLYHQDSLACLDLLEAEARGQFRRSRREFSVLMVERLLDQLRFGRDQRLAFYERGFRWAIESETLNETDLAALRARYGKVKDGLASLVSAAAGADPEALWGGAEAAGIAARCLEATAPVIDKAIEARADGRLAQDLVEVAWSWAHLHSNRIGVLNVGEASLRFLMHRLYGDGLVTTA
ncbi:MAG TPA: thiopeptide-type bacteriocin biosynthesis protein [Candidatus Saccharimonadales bacterium]|nr:thiopeptide-type bacteriocin biosynthesis protein [Candidatus Saccharimonadales bacterium]